jgi:hypothetical protein
LAVPKVAVSWPTECELLWPLPPLTSSSMRRTVLPTHPSRRLDEQQAAGLLIGGQA